MKSLILSICLFALTAIGLAQEAHFVKTGKFTGEPVSVAKITNNNQYALSQIAGSSVQFRSGVASLVSFTLSGKSIWTQREGVAPYILYGDDAGSVKPPVKAWVLGTYKLVVMQGTSTYTYSFEVVDKIKTKSAVIVYGKSNKGVPFYSAEIPAPDSGLFVVKYGLDSLVLSWATPTAPAIPVPPVITPTDPVVTPPVPVVPTPDPKPPVVPDPKPPVVPPYNGTALRFDSVRHGFLDPDGDFIPDIRKAGVHWARLDTASWKEINVPSGASEASILSIISQADATTPGAIINFPAGTFTVSKIVLTAATNVLFRGSGRGVTNLKFTAVQGGTACFYGQPSDPGQRNKATVGTPAWSNRITIGAAGMREAPALYQPGKYVWVRSEVPPFWAEKYRMYFQNNRMWHYETCRIVSVNAAEGWFEVEDEFPMSMETNLSVQPLIPCVGIGVENMTVTSPDIGSGTPYSQVFQILRGYDCWGSKLTFEQPLGYAFDFPESSHCEFTYSLVKEAPKQLIDLSARAYGGLMGCSHTVLDSIEYRGCRHSLLTQDGISQCLMDRIVSKNSDTHTPHTGFMFHSLITRYWNQKGTNGMPTTWIFGVHPDNTQHYGGPIGCYSYRVKMDGAPTQNSNRGLKFGMEDGNVVSHAQLEFSLNQNADYTPAIQVWNLAYNVVLKHSKIVVPPEKVQSKYVGRQRLIDIVPGDVYKYTDPSNGRYYPLKQTGWSSYPGISNGANNGGEYFSGSEAMLPGVPSSYSIRIFDLEVFGIPQEKWFEGFQGARPVWSDIRMTTDRTVVMPEGFPGLPNLRAAQLAY